MNDSVSLTPIQGPSKLTCMIVISISQLRHWLHQLPRVGRGCGVNTNWCTEFLLQIKKHREDSAMLLGSNKQQHKEKAQNINK
jgi:hypothetical protein